MKGTKLLSTREVGELLGFSPRTISRWCREGKFPSAKKLGRVWRIAPEDPYLYVGAA